MCSEITPRARISDTRIPQLMQPWQLYCLPIQQQSHLQIYKGERARKSTYVPIVSSPITKIRKAKSLTNCQFSSTISQCEILASELFLTLCRRIYRCDCILLCTRSYAALRAADLDWIVGPGYSLGGTFWRKTMGTNQKPWKTMKPPWKTMETNQKPWKTMKPPWKTTKVLDLRPLGKVIIFRVKQTEPSYYI